MHKDKRIIAAAGSAKDFETAVLSGADTVFYLAPDIMTLREDAEKAHMRGKRIYIHFDLAAGLGKDRSGIEFAKNSGVDGILSTRANLIKLASEAGLKTVQRFFMVDSRSVSSTAETLKSSRADMIEIMPGIAYKVINKLKHLVEVPIIAGGLIETEEEASLAVQCGAYAVSTGKKELWN